MQGKMATEAKGFATYVISAIKTYFEEMDIFTGVNEN